MRFLFLPFVVLPILEMVVLIKVGGLIGLWKTVGLVLLTAFIGAWMLRRQGFATLTRANARLAAGELPAQEVVEGFLLAIGGALLLTPGFITDGIGFLCLAPGSRHLLVAWLMRRAVVSGQGFYFSSGGPGPFPGEGPGSVTVEGEFRHESEKPVDRIEHNGDEEPRNR